MNKLNKYYNKLPMLLAWVWLVTFTAFTIGMCTWSIMWVISLWGRFIG